MKSLYFFIHPSDVRLSSPCHHHIPQIKSRSRRRSVAIITPDNGEQVTGVWCCHLWQYVEDIALKLLGWQQAVARGEGAYSRLGLLCHASESALSKRITKSESETHFLSIYCRLTRECKAIRWYIKAWLDPPAVQPQRLKSHRPGRSPSGPRPRSRAIGRLRFQLPYHTRAL